MSIDSLFEHILLTEQQVSENIRQLHEGNANVKLTRTMGGFVLTWKVLKSNLYWKYYNYY